MTQEQFKFAQLVRIGGRVYGQLVERHPQRPDFRVVLLTGQGDYGSTEWFHPDQIEVIE